MEPGPTGVIAVEYQFVGPADQVALASIPIDDINLSTGTPYNAPGMTISLGSCYYDPFVLYTFTFMNTNSDPTYTAYMMVEPHGETAKLIVAECPGDRIELPATLYNHLGLNTGCVVGTEESSWGAIKSMMD